MNFYLRAKKKFLRNKLKRTGNKKDYIHNTQFGFKIILDLSKDVDCNFFLLEFEYDYLRFFQKNLKQGSKVIDVGANIGIYSLLASKKIGSEGKVYAFEPSDWAHSRLVENLKLNCFKNVEVIKKVISDRNGTATFFICDDDAYNSLSFKPMKEVQRTENISMTTLDRFCEQRNVNNIDLLKIDTEGADYLVLKGAQKLLCSDNPPIIFCEYNRLIKSGFDFNLTDMENLLKDADYKLFEIRGKKLLEFDSTISQTSELICIPVSKLKNFGKN